jgi:hypothetical protein
MSGVFIIVVIGQHRKAMAAGNGEEVCDGCIVPCAYAVVSCDVQIEVVDGDGTVRSV